jgi:hypothetical protein
MASARADLPLQRAPCYSTPSQSDSPYLESEQARSDVSNTTPAPFLVLGLPRSRTAWLSRFLTYGGWICGHEELRHIRSFDDVRTWFSQPYIGSAETAASTWWRMIDRFAPGARIAVVRRNPKDAVESLMRIPGVRFDRSNLEKTMARLDRKLDQIEGRVPNVLSVQFGDLENEDTCARVFEHCLLYPHDTNHWAMLDPINIQADMRAMMRYFEAYRPVFDKLSAIAKHQTLAAMNLRTPIAPEGVAFQTESFDAWIKDAPVLFDSHLILVGEAPGDWQAKNIPLMRSLYDAGTMQITTARCNGRMFGYLMTLITPSLASQNLKSAVHTTFYASPEFPGMGMKLQRVALAGLKERGVGNVFMQAGVRGSGERIAAIYRRMGAESDGQMFRLDLKEV